MRAKNLRKSKRGLYGDVIEELDYNVGRIIDTLREESLDSNTYVFTSDNGPWFLEKHRKEKFERCWRLAWGTAAPLRAIRPQPGRWLSRPLRLLGSGKIPAGRTNSEIARTRHLSHLYSSRRRDCLKTRDRWQRYKRPCPRQEGAKAPLTIPFLPTNSTRCRRR